MDDRFNKVRGFLNNIVLGKEKKIELCLCSLLSRGHILIEDLPGMGKTLLAHAISKALGLEFSRIQFTSDMLPADITGVSVFEVATSTFTFHKGPIFASVVLADEINRASPKAQSALLEAMEEKQVSVDGDTYKLPDPFFVIATQNPVEQSGTFPLPESQLDRFFMRICLGYPDRVSERKLLEQGDRREILPNLDPVFNKDMLLALQAEVVTIKTSSALLNYVQDLIENSRNSVEFTQGISPRAAQDLVRGAKAWAMLTGRDYVIPEDVQDVIEATIEHRLSRATEQGEHVSIGTTACEKLVAMTPI